MSEFPAIRQLLPERVEVPGAEDLERLYLHPGGQHLRLDFVSSLDGAVEVDGRSEPLGGPADRAAFMAMRAVCDVVMVGAGTVRAENYGPVRLGDAVRGRRQMRDQAELPRLAIVTARGTLDPAARVFGGNQPVVVLTTSRTIKERPDLGAVAEMVECGDERVDLPAAVAELQKMGLGRVLCEGGPELTRSLLIAGLVDELCLTFSPLLIGAQHRVMGGDGPLPHPERFRLAGLLEGEGLLLTRYERSD
jgi:riboflavin-specific deaminase-like protein